MKATHTTSICEQAQGYYYEYLCGRAAERIPAEILTHLHTCHLCQGGVNKLKNILAESEKHIAETTGQAGSTITDILESHFAYLAVAISCATVRPFLPALADPTKKIAVSTPITVHLDKCPQCANDLETIRQLDLTPEQLHRLGQLFGQELVADVKDCWQARDAIVSVVAMDFSETTGQVLKHVCACLDCRRLIYQQRKARMEKLSREPEPIEQSPIPCDAISVADIFDYVVPYGFAGEYDRYEMFRRPLKSHLINCPKCLNRMQRLHNSIYGILERQESGIVTCFKIDTSAGKAMVSDPAHIHKDWPIKVQVFDKLGGTSPREAYPACRQTGLVKCEASIKYRVWRRLLTPGTEKLIKPVAVAATILLAVIFLLKGTAVRAVELAEIYKALAHVRNVCLTAFVPEKPEPTQKIWISQTSNIMLLKTGAQWVLWDIKSKSQKSKDLNTGSIEITKLKNDILAKVEETMDVPWGLLPFDDISALPKNAKWQKVTDDDIDTNITNTEVYDLIWIEEGLSGSIVYRKWRGYIDAKTKLLKRAEWWEKLARQTNGRLASDKEYKLTTTISVTYPTVSEIQAAIKDAGF